MPSHRWSLLHQTASNTIFAASTSVRWVGRTGYSKVLRTSSCFLRSSSNGWSKHSFQRSAFTLTVKHFREVYLCFLFATSSVLLSSFCWWMLICLSSHYLGCCSMMAPKETSPPHSSSQRRQWSSKQPNSIAGSTWHTGSLCTIAGMVPQESTTGAASARVRTTPTPLNRSQWKAILTCMEGQTSSLTTSMPRF